VLATGVGGPLTGKGITGIALVDDAFKNRKDAESRLKRDSVWEWFTDVVWTRLEDDASCIVIGTMWHTDDLINRLLTRGAGDDGVPFELVRLPAIAEENDILGRKEGEALWPETLGRQAQVPDREAARDRDDARAVLVRIALPAAAAAARQPHLQRARAASSCRSGSSTATASASAPTLQRRRRRRQTTAPRSCSR
jgi:hypothetical protein